MYLNKEDFFKGIPEKEQNLLASEMVVFDVNAMANKIIVQYEKIKQKNTAILDAAKINNCRFDGNRGKSLIKESTKMSRLEPWLKRIRKNETKDKALIHQLNKVTHLGTSETSFKIVAGEKTKEQI